MGVCRLQSLQYICAPFGPFVQGLGRQVFILETGVRFPYGLQNEQTHIPHDVGFFMPSRLHRCKIPTARVCINNLNL